MKPIKLKSVLFTINWSKENYFMCIVNEMPKTGRIEPFFVWRINKLVVLDQLINEVDCLLKTLSPKGRGIE